MPALQATIEDGVPFLVSRVMRAAGFRHAFSMRAGGVSAAPFDSLNLGVAGAEGTPDDPANVAENRRRFLRAAGLGGRTLVQARQVHGTAVMDADGADLTSGLGDADALIASRPERCVAVRTADCVPILVASPEHNLVAAVHAGWRGLVGGVIGQAVAALAARGADPGRLIAAIGPSIGAEAYEVGPEVAAAFMAAGIGGAVDRTRGREHVDCHLAARIQLRHAGLPEHAIDGEPCCTYSHPESFFSYRRDGARSGRLASVIGPR